jgi:hypothetical protein
VLFVRVKVPEQLMKHREKAELPAMVLLTDLVWPCGIHDRAAASGPRATFAESVLRMMLSVPRRRL